MKNKAIIIFLISLAVVIVLVIVFDFVGGQPRNRADNPYEFNVDDYKKVDPELVKYKETKQIKVDAEYPHGIYWKNGKIAIVADNNLQIIDASGKQLLKKMYNNEIYAIGYINDTIILGFKTYLAIVNNQGDVIFQSDEEDIETYITSVASLDTAIFVADAGNRRVIVYNKEAQRISEFHGESGSSELHGFIIPSANFDLAINSDNELWVVNPGMHSIQNYSFTGELRGYWEKASITIDGFSGCCNPANFTFLPNGNFITSEKGLVRIKEYKPSGELVAVVAAPSKFEEEGKSPDVTTDNDGNIWVLDKDKKLIRVFESKI